MENETVQPATYSAQDIARYFIEKALEQRLDEEVSEGIDNLKLQKLLYFSQAASLSVHNKELFREDILAWPYGPIVEEVYRSYKGYKNLPITEIRGGKKIEDKETVEFLEGMWELFDKYSSIELMKITHKHRPYIDAYAQGRGTVIPKEVLQEYYQNVFELKNAEESV